MTLFTIVTDQHLVAMIVFTSLVLFLQVAPMSATTGSNNLIISKSLVCGSLCPNLVELTACGLIQDLTSYSFFFFDKFGGEGPFPLFQFPGVDDNGKPTTNIPAGSRIYVYENFFEPLLVGDDNYYLFKASQVFPAFDSEGVRGSDFLLAYNDVLYDTFELLGQFEPRLGLYFRISRNPPTLVFDITKWEERVLSIEDINTFSLTQPYKCARQTRAPTVKPTNAHRMQGKVASAPSKKPTMVPVPPPTSLPTVTTPSPTKFTPRPTVKPTNAKRKPTNKPTKTPTI